VRDSNKGKLHRSQKKGRDENDENDRGDHHNNEDSADDSDHVTADHSHRSNKQKQRGIQGYATKRRKQA
jgi:hypothetical protein